MRSGPIPVSLPELVVKLGEGRAGGVKGVVVRIADAGNQVPVVAGRAGQLKRRPRGDDMEAPRGVEHVGEPEQVPLVGPPPVMEHQQPLGLGFRRALQVGEGFHQPTLASWRIDERASRSDSLRAAPIWRIATAPGREAEEAVGYGEAEDAAVLFR